MESGVLAPRGHDGLLLSVRGCAASPLAVLMARQTVARVCTGDECGSGVDEL